MLERTGRAFERLFIGSSTDLDYLFEQKYDIPELKSGTDFARDVPKFIKASKKLGIRCPNTPIAKRMFYGLKNRLTKILKREVDLWFLPTGNVEEGTFLDAFHYTDVVIHISGINTILTLDLYYVENEIIDFLKEKWIKSFNRKTWYTEANFQDDLFRYKKGLKVVKKLIKAKLGGREASLFPIEKSDLEIRDLSVFRPSNHFIVTPDHISVRRKRLNFLNFLARYYVDLVKIEEGGLPYG